MWRPLTSLLKPLAGGLQGSESFFTSLVVTPFRTASAQAAASAKTLCRAFTVQESERNQQAWANISKKLFSRGISKASGDYAESQALGK